jgi:hypothetical protein
MNTYEWIGMALLVGTIIKGNLVSDKWFNPVWDLVIFLIVAVLFVLGAE